MSPPPASRRVRSGTDTSGSISCGADGPPLPTVGAGLAERGVRARACARWTSMPAKRAFKSSHDVFWGVGTPLSPRTSALRVLGGSGGAWAGPDAHLPRSLDQVRAAGRARLAGSVPTPSARGGGGGRAGPGRGRARGTQGPSGARVSAGGRQGAPLPCPWRAAPAGGGGAGAAGPGLGRGRAACAAGCAARGPRSSPARSRFSRDTCCGSRASPETGPSLRPAPAARLRPARSGAAPGPSERRPRAPRAPPPGFLPAAHLPSRWGRAGPRAGGPRGNQRGPGRPSSAPTRPTRVGPRGSPASTAPRSPDPPQTARGRDRPPGAAWGGRGPPSGALPPQWSHLRLQG